MSLSKCLRNRRCTLPFVVAIGIATGLAMYLSASLSTLQPGFPLDDAWIHQTYARNLVEYGVWAFSPEESSAGSTAPLWTILLTPGYLLGLSPLSWVVVLAICQLGLLAWLGTRWLRARVPGSGDWWVLLLLTEWHLLWAALSGMETLLIGLAALVVFALMEERQPPWFWLGILIGVAVWIRPDAVTLFLPVGWVWLFTKPRARKKHWENMLWTGVGFLLLFIPYLLFNRSLSGEWWPSTFYAKQAEYGALRDSPFLSRLAGQYLLPLVGVGATLLPGSIYMLVLRIRERRWDELGGFLWIAGLLALYAVRLPVQYQHGRYAMPVLPLFLLLGMEGLLKWAKPASEKLAMRLLSRVWMVSVIAIQIVFFIRGARAYAQDVAIVESEMVATAIWIRDELPDEALLAVHDIGAVGYFTPNPIVDLAGLVSPDVIPFIRDEVALKDFLDEESAAYLVTFPGWYPALTAEAEMIYSSGAPFSPAAGGENMSVYRWP